MKCSKEVIDPKTQIADKLRSINKSLTKEDRNAYISKYLISQGNLSLYLNGTVYDLNKGIQMLKFFKKRIDSRNSTIKELIK